MIYSSCLLVTCNLKGLFFIFSYLMSFNKEEKSLGVELKSKVKEMGHVKMVKGLERDLGTKVVVFDHCCI